MLRAGSLVNPFASTAAPSSEASTAAILEFSDRQDPKRAASLTMTAQATGFAGGLLVGGALTQYGPWPTRLCFAVLVGLLLALLAGTSFLPHDRNAGENGEWRAKMPFVPKELHRRFATAAAAILTAYTFGVLVLSLGGQVEHELIGSSNAFVNGAVLSVFGGVLSALYLVGYLSMAAVAFVLGAVATVWGLGLAVKLGAAAITVLSIATFVRALATRADDASHSVPLSLPRGLK
jgi:MFS family permease